jgi:hypothetical protein
VRRISIQIRPQWLVRKNKTTDVMEMMVSQQVFFWVRIPSDKLHIPPYSHDIRLLPPDSTMLELR